MSLSIIALPLVPVIDMSRHSSRFGNESKLPHAPTHTEQVNLPTATTTFDKGALHCNLRAYQRTTQSARARVPGSKGQLMDHSQLGFVLATPTDKAFSIPDRWTPPALRDASKSRQVALRSYVILFALSVFSISPCLCPLSLSLSLSLQGIKEYTHCRSAKLNNRSIG